MRNQEKRSTTEKSREVEKDVMLQLAINFSDERDNEMSYASFSSHVNLITIFLPPCVCNRLWVPCALNLIASTYCPSHIDILIALWNFFPFQALSKLFSLIMKQYSFQDLVETETQMMWDFSLCVVNMFY